VPRLVLGFPLADKPGIDALGGARWGIIEEASGDKQKASQQGKEAEGSEHGKRIEDEERGSQDEGLLVIKACGENAYGPCQIRVPDGMTAFLGITTMPSRM
jgi:hypothetical protein